MTISLWIFLLIGEAVWGVVSDVAPPTKMILLALMTFGVVKWQAWHRSMKTDTIVTRSETLAWFFLTPTLDAHRFFHQRLATAQRPPLRQWIAGIARVSIGVILLAAVAPRFVSSGPVLAGWIAMIGIALILHFGLLDLIVLCWRSQGRDIQPLMNRPLFAASLSEFWGKRWNTAFRDFAHEQVFRPLCRHWSVSLAVWSAFAFSALIHELAISVPAGGGYGLPTIYFLLQSAGIKIERVLTRTRWWPQTILVKWLFAACFVIGPAPLLFHSPFIMRVINPLIPAIN